MPKRENHPLTNREDSPHYFSSGSESTIERFECKYTVSQLIAWAEITEAKYNDPGRKNKGQEEKDIRKALSYKRYKEMLQELVKRSPTATEMTPKRVYEILNIKWNY